MMPPDPRLCVSCGFTLERCIGLKWSACCEACGREGAKRRHPVAAKLVGGV